MSQDKNIDYYFTGSIDEAMKVIEFDEDLMRSKMFSANQISFKSKSRRLYISDVCYAPYSNKSLIDFILENKDKPKDFWCRSFKRKMANGQIWDFNDMANFNISTEEGKILHHDEKTKCRRDFMLEASKIESKTIGQKALSLIGVDTGLRQGEKDILWDEAEKNHPYGCNDGFNIRYDLVQTVIALDNIQQLELKE